jgi:hypothetical protein
VADPLLNVELKTIDSVLGLGLVNLSRMVVPVDRYVADELPEIPLAREGEVIAEPS